MRQSNKPYPLYELPEVHDFREMVCMQADLYPEKNAFSWPGKKKEVFSRTRLEFKEDVAGLTAWMMDSLPGGAHIGIVATNSYEWIVVFTAAVIAGCVAVPVNPDLPEEEVASLLQFADCSLIFYGSGYAEFLNHMDKIRAYDLKAVSDLAAIGSQLVENGRDGMEEADPNVEDTCAIFFTSATTGPAKGVMLSQKNLISDINAACKNFVLEGDTLAVLPFYHCFGLITAIYKVFNYGGGTYIARSLKRIQKTIQEVRPQTMFLVPLFVETFHRKIWDTIAASGKEKQVRQMMRYSNTLLKWGVDVRRRLFSSITDTFGGNLEYIICGGALLDEMYIQDFASWGIQILNGYGITECSPVVAVNRNHFIKKGSVGQILEGIQVHESSTGEIWVKGDMVMQGYYKDPQATGAVLCNGWLNTMDLGYVDEDNFLFLTGRSKNLIILSNGENISPEQIEMSIKHDRAVEEVVVYQQDGKICCQLYPSPDHMGDRSYFEGMVREYNQHQPLNRQIARLELRDSEFEKNATKKILRYKVTGDHYE